MSSLTRKMISAAAAALLAVPIAGAIGQANADPQPCASCGSGSGPTNEVPANPGEHNLGGGGAKSGQAPPAKPAKPVNPNPVNPSPVNPSH